VARTLIAEADVARFAPDCPIVLDRDTIITPSALDKASRLRIPVVRLGEERPTSRACFCAALGEGSYLVMVSQGRRQWFRLAPDGSAPTPMEQA